MSLAFAAKNEVVLIDDSPEICEVLSFYLSEFYDVETFTDPKLAVERVRAGSVSAVLTDLKMASYSGMEVLKLVRGFSVVPVVLISGCPLSPEESARFTEAGLSGVVTKPFAEVELRLTLQRLLEKS